MSDINSLISSIKDENVVAFSKTTHGLLYSKVAKGLSDMSSSVGEQISEGIGPFDEAEKDLSPEQKAYKELYNYTLVKYDSDAKSPNDLSDEEKKKFFNELKKEWAKHPDNKPEKKE